MSEKTCGNCELRNSGHMMCRSKPYLSEGCGFWNESRASLKQRYEQLEQVAKDMCNYLYLLPVSLPGCPEYDHVRGFKDRLRELVVSLDD